LWTDFSEEIMAGSSLADFSTLKIEAIHSSETSVHTISTSQKTTFFLPYFSLSWESTPTDNHFSRKAKVCWQSTFCIWGVDSNADPSGRWKEPAASGRRLATREGTPRATVLRTLHEQQLCPYHI
jgi:hypothetical protein